MSGPRRAVLALLLAVALAGCGGLLGAETATPTLTPAPVPETTATPTAEATPTARDGQVRPEGWTALQPEYNSLRPTCERPPGLVIHIQVAALQSNDPATNEGINTTWRFASPSNRGSVGTYSNFVWLITEQYSPLLTAETVTYGPLTVEDGVAVRNVTVQTGGEATTYRWEVSRQTGDRYEGCWMTTSVGRVR